MAKFHSICVLPLVMVLLLTHFTFFPLAIASQQQVSNNNQQQTSQHQATIVITTGNNHP
jgi:hypothetical protein